MVVPFVPNSKTTFVYIQICIFDYSIFVCEINTEALKTHSFVPPSQEIMWNSKLSVCLSVVLHENISLRRSSCSMHKKICLLYSTHNASFLKSTPHTNDEMNLHIVTFITVPTGFNYLEQNMYKDSHICMGTVLPDTRGSVRKFIM